MLRGDDREVLLAVLVQLLVQRRLLVDHRIEPVELVLDRRDLLLSLAEGVGEPVGRPLRFLAGVRRGASDLGVSFGDRTHELEPVGELCDALRPEQTVDLRPGPDVGLHGPLRESSLGPLRLSLGVVALFP